MVNINGTIVTQESAILSIYNRGFTYGDALFETIKVVPGKVLFWEDHYFRLMASMRILRMEIPMNFTLEFLESEIFDLIEANEFSKSPVRIKLTINRKTGGFYNPENKDVDYRIVAELLNDELYLFNEADYRVDLFKDHYIAPDLLSTLKSNNKLINVMGSIYADENGFDNCFILNTNKYIVEALNANIFLVNGQTIKTPPLNDGCLKGIMRKQIIEIIKMIPEYTFEEDSITSFELQKADELFLTNVITGIQPITNYRRKVYEKEVSKNLLAKLNLKVRLS